MHSAEDLRETVVFNSATWEKTTTNKHQLLNNFICRQLQLRPDSDAQQKFLTAIAIDTDGQPLKDVTFQDNQLHGLMHNPRWYLSVKNLVADFRKKIVFLGNQEQLQQELHQLRAENEEQRRRFDESDKTHRQTAKQLIADNKVQYNQYYNEVKELRAEAFRLHKELQQARCTEEALQEELQQVRCAEEAQWEEFGQKAHKLQYKIEQQADEIEQQADVITEARITLESVTAKCRVQAGKVAQQNLQKVRQRVRLENMLDKALLSSFQEDPNYKALNTQQCVTTTESPVLFGSASTILTLWPGDSRVICYNWDVLPPANIPTTFYFAITSLLIKSTGFDTLEGEIKLLTEQKEVGPAVKFFFNTVGLQEWLEDLQVYVLERVKALFDVYVDPELVGASPFTLFIHMLAVWKVIAKPKKKVLLKAAQVQTGNDATRYLLGVGCHPEKQQRVPFWLRTVRTQIYKEITFIIPSLGADRVLESEPPLSDTEDQD